MTLDQYAQQYGLRSAAHDLDALHPQCRSAAHTAPTQRDEHTGQMVRGTVHDPRKQMGGVAGDAGSSRPPTTSPSSSQAILDGGRAILSPLIVEKMTTPQQAANMPTCASWLGHRLAVLSDAR